MFWIYAPNAEPVSAQAFSFWHAFIKSILLFTTRSELSSCSGWAALLSLHKHSGVCCTLKFFIRRWNWIPETEKAHVRAWGLINSDANQIKKEPGHSTPECSFFFVDNDSYIVRRPHTHTLICQRRATQKETHDMLKKFLSLCARGTGRHCSKS